MDSCEVTVVIKEEERVYRQKFLSYEDVDGVVSLSQENPALRSMVEEAIANFKGEPEEIIIRAVYVWQK